VRARFLLLMTLAPATLMVAGCGDEVTDPDGLIQSAEAEAVARSAGALPSLVSLMEATEPTDDRSRATLFRARELWDAGTAVDDPRGAARRRLAVGYALPVLLEQIPEPEWVDARGRVDDWVATASSMLQHLSIPGVEERLDAATRHLERSDAAYSDRSRVYHLLLASSELVETTPRFVARTLVADAQAQVQEAGVREPRLPDRVMERAERLKDWAVQAVEEGEYLLAIQRAYYAIQLVGE
jgi:hypothetical protein